MNKLKSKRIFIVLFGVIMFISGCGKQQTNLDNNKEMDCHQEEGKSKNTHKRSNSKTTSKKTDDELNQISKEKQELKLVTNQINQPKIQQLTNSKQNSTNQHSKMNKKSTYESKPKMNGKYCNIKVTAKQQLDKNSTQKNIFKVRECQLIEAKEILSYDYREVKSDQQKEFLENLKAMEKEFKDKPEYICHIKK